MIEVTEKTSRLLTRLIADKRAHYWNLYNPETNKVLYKIDIDPTKPIGANVWGCCDLSGVDWQHNFSRLERLRYYFALGYILRTTDGSIYFDGKRMGQF